MDTWVWVVVIVAVVVVLIAVALAMRSRGGSSKLQDRFGPEYDRTVDREGDRRAAEAELKERARAHDQLEIRPLSPAARDRYVAEWQQVQARFVDQPDSAVAEAEELVGRVMRDRGYPVDDFEAQAALVSVDHPRVVENYRSAHAVYLRNQERLADTDDLRRAVLHYRSLFDDLLVADSDQSTPSQSN